LKQVYIIFKNNIIQTRGRRGRDCMVVGLTTNCAIGDYHHYSCEFESRSWQGVLNMYIMW